MCVCWEINKLSIALITKNSASPFFLFPRNFRRVAGSYRSFHGNCSISEYTIKRQVQKKWIAYQLFIS